MDLHAKLKDFLKAQEQIEEEPSVFLEEDDDTDLEALLKQYEPPEFRPDEFARALKFRGHR